jgi:hypothetical protein
MRRGRRVSRKLAIFFLALAIIVPTQVIGAPVAPVSAASKSFTKTSAPVITGTAKVNGLLSAKVSAWTPSRITTTYQWKRNGVPIAGARAAKYTATAVDLNKTLTVTVTGAGNGVKSVSVTSAKTQPVGFANCTELNKKYPHGVGRTNAVDNAKKKVTTFKKTPSTPLMRSLTATTTVSPARSSPQRNTQSCGRSGARA